MMVASGAPPSATPTTFINVAAVVGTAPYYATGAYIIALVDKAWQAWYLFDLKRPGGSKNNANRKLLSAKIHSVQGYLLK